MATRDEILEVVDAFIPFANAIANLTLTKLDDQAVSVLRVARQSDILVDWLVGLFSGEVPVGALRTTQIPADVLAEFAAQGIERPVLERFLELAWPILEQMIRKWLDL